MLHVDHVWILIWVNKGRERERERRAVHYVESYAAAAAAKSLQLCPTLCDPIDVSPPGSPVPGILQARTLEWVAISFSNAWKWKVKVKSLSYVRLLSTPWTAAYQAPPSMRFSRQEYWSGVPLPSPVEGYSWPQSLRRQCWLCQLTHIGFSLASATYWPCSLEQITCSLFCFFF